ncbi:fibronectin type III domain-containing protein, partial [Flammeovirga sp. EKP202]|uniref:fibronectin type III domain-containing protein n=1 Tax=Flammeovirga sp. EKP202 TaxID=2770592 RepID=UPI00165F8CF8
ALSTDRDDFDNNILTQGTVDNGVSIDLENLSPASTYFFRVKAKNATTESAFSDIVEGTTTAIPTLDIPANLVVSNPTTTQLTFTWEKVQDATSYEYALSTDRDDFDNNILTQGTVDNGVSIELENLTPASTYFFRVKAKNATTESAFSDIVEGTTTAIPTLDIPANVVVSNPTTTQLTFNWEKVQDATSYEYELSTDRDDFENNISNKGMVMNATTVQFNNLSPASSYFFRVKAINSNTSSAFSDIIEGITEAIPTLDAPLNLVISNASTTQLTASWDKVENATSYDYEVSTDEHFTESQIIIKNSVNTTEVILENLVSSTTYFVRVKAKNEHVESDYSTTASLATIDVVSSIDDHFNSSIKVAPVPASQYIIITFDDNPRGQFVLFSLKNTSGQTVKEWNKVGQKSITLDINTLPSNIYLLQILIDGQYFTKKIMKK